jgi:hypothetical protein
MYGAPGEYEAREPKHLADQMRAVRDCVAALPPDRQFAVVCEEF